MTKPRKKRSPIWKLSKEAFKELWETSPSLKVVLAHFGLNNKGGNHVTARNRAAQEGLEPKRFQSNNITALHAYRAGLPSKVILKKGTKCSSRQLRIALTKIGRPYKCEICDQKGTWKNKPLTLPVDHKDGDTTNNDPKNLRFLCPNCHSQTGNFSGRKTRRCRRPSKTLLQKLLWSQPTTKIAQAFGVSDKAVEKWAKGYNIEKPPRGYWAKIQSKYPK